MPITMTRMKPTVLLLLACPVALLLPNPVDSYAAWLKCYIDLDETEVVMSHPIVEADKADHDVAVMVATEEGEWKANYHFPADTNTTLQVKLQVPSELENSDVQYVIESEDEGAEFIDPAMCDGRRAFSQSYDRPVTLEIDGSSAEKVTLKAAWAKGFEAVKLTPTLVLTREGASEQEKSAEL